MASPVRLFTDAELVEGLERHGWNTAGFRAYAEEVGCSLTLVRIRERNIRIARGEPVREFEISWETRLRRHPTLAEIDKLARTHGDDACIVRWGGVPSALRRLAPDRPDRKNRAASSF